MGEILLSSKDKLRKLKIPDKINPRLAEEIGIHLGDGSMNVYGKGYLYSLEGHFNDDREYYQNYIAPLMKELYNLDVRLRERKCAGVYGFQIGSKGLISFKKDLGLPLGSKKNIEIPNIILNAKKEIISSFIRGFFDTDGGIYLEKKNKKLYPRIQITNYSNKIMFQLKEVLENIFKFNLCLYLDKNTNVYRIIIRGENNFKKWMSLIGTNNPKNFLKYERWKNQKIDY